MGEGNTCTEPQLKLFDKLLAGAIAGISGTLAIYPIDSIKTRLQAGYFSSKSAFNGLHVARKMLREEGLRGFYRGLPANLIGVTPEKAIKLAVNDAARAYFARKHNFPLENLPVHYGMLCGAMAGFCQVVATNPMEIVKIQMQLASTLPQTTERPSLLATVTGLGFKGLYRGATATLCRDVPFSIVFFQGFASFKKLLSSGNPRVDSLSLTNTLAAGTISGALAAYAATPMDVVKTRLQSHLRDHTCMAEIYRDVWRKEGTVGFFKGGLQRCLIVAPLFAISLAVYELQQHYMNTLSSM